MLVNTKKFQKTIWDYYETNGRHDLPWRKTKDPYKILISEVMLQQTQVTRVILKYKSFLLKFPTVEALANASLGEVLKEWQGLGYNRRAKYLKLCAEKVVIDLVAKTFNFKKLNVRPSSPEATIRENFNYLTSLPGIGPATAGDILAFSYNTPVPVIETNIRSVFIHFFFSSKSPTPGTGEQKISDVEILSLVKKTLPTFPYPRDRGKGVREWYWALFDYGAYLKSTKIKNPNHRSKQYVKQSPFEGSNREKRSAILKLILEKPRTEKGIVKTLGYEKEVVVKNLEKMVKEKLIQKKKNKFFV